MASHIIDLWQQRDVLKEKNPRAWFTQLTDAFNTSPSVLKFGEDDNLDTGNASPEVEPFRPFVDSLLNVLLTDGDPHRRYTQLNAHMLGREELARAVRNAFAALGIPNEPETFACLAYGATQAWEACCRHVIQHPGDVIIVPTPTYTLLVPPIMLAQGEVVFVDIGPSGILTAAQLSAVCAQENARILAQWVQGLPTIFRMFVIKAEACLRLPHGTLGQHAPQTDDGIISLLGGAVDVGIKGRDTMLTTTLIELFSFSREQTEKLSRDGIFARFCSPPRVAGLLFLNPTLGGRYYTMSDVKELEAVVRANQLTVIEDLAYTLMPLDAASLRQIGRFGCLPECSRLSLTILGLSKPLSIANHRVSVVLAPRRDLVESVDGYIKASVAQVASYLYTAVTDALNATEALTKYVSTNALDSSFGYKRKLRMALTCLTGGALDSRQKTELLQAIVGSGGGVSPSDPSIGLLAQKGLSDFFVVKTQPDGGIFLLVDAAPAISALRRVGLRGMESAYDLSVFLAFALKVRVIPEEVMNGWSEFNKGTLLRMSFSTTTSTFARAAMEMFKLFAEVATMEPLQTDVVGSVAAPPFKSTESNLPRDRYEGRELTPAEQSMFVEQMQRAKAYTVVSPTRITGPMDLKRFQAAVDVLVERHPSLRFSFPFRASSGKPCCCATAPPEPVIIDNISNMRPFAEKDFDITNGRLPLSALRLFKVHDTEHILLLVQHHIVTDNGSIGVLMSDLFQLYGAADAATLPPPTGDALSTLPWSKTEDVLWHAERLSSLEDPFPLSDDESITSVDMRMEIDSEAHQRIIETSGGRGTEFEVFMTITAMALHAALAELTVASPPSSFGVLLPASLRLSRESQQATGFGVNSLVCKVAVPEESPFSVLVAETAEAVRNCREHISAPLPQVAKYLREKGLERVGEIAIAVRPPPSPPNVKIVDGAEVAWSQVLVDDVRVDGTLHGTAKHPIGFVFSRKSIDTFSGFVVDIIVSSATPPGTAQRLLGALQFIVKHLHAGLTAADINCDGETFFDSLEEGREPTTNKGVVLLPHSLFMSITRAGTQRGIWCPDQSVTISSSEVAHRMMHVCSLVQSRMWKRVGLYLPPGPAAVIAMMGVLAAGATCVLRRPGTQSSFDATLDGLLLAEGDEASVGDASRCAAVRRDGALPATVAAPSLPKRILDTLATIRPHDPALEYLTAEGTHIVLSQDGLRRQCIAWGRVLRFSVLPGNDTKLPEQQQQPRVVSCNTSVDTPFFVCESVVPLLLEMQLILASDVRRPVGVSQTPAVHTVLLEKGDAVQSALSTNWSLIGCPVLMGPITREMATEVFSAFPKLSAFPVVFAPRECGLCAVVLERRDTRTASPPMRFGSSSSGARLQLMPGSSGGGNVANGEVGQLFVQASWMTVNPRSAERETSVPIKGCFGRVVSTSGRGNASVMVAVLPGDCLLQPTDAGAAGGSGGLRLAKITTASSATASAPLRVSPSEEIVKDLFSEILEIPKKTLTSTSDFFDVGGDSFTLSQLANRLQAHGSQLTVAVLINKMLRDMTIHGIAQLLPKQEEHHNDPLGGAQGQGQPPAQAQSHRSATPQSRSRSGSLIKTTMPTVGSTTSVTDDGDVDWENEIYD